MGDGETAVGGASVGSVVGPDVGEGDNAGVRVGGGAEVGDGVAVACGGGVHAARMVLARTRLPVTEAISFRAWRRVSRPS